MENNEGHNRVEVEDNLPAQNEQVLEQNIVNKDYLSHLSGNVFKDDVILGNLMTKLDLENLKKLRKLKYSCFQRTKCCWMKRAWVHVRNKHVAGNRSLQEFSAFFQQCLEFRMGPVIPVQNLSLTLTRIPVWGPEWDNFITVCGSYIKSLEIEISQSEPQRRSTDQQKHFNFLNLQVPRKLSDREKDFLDRVRMLMKYADILHLKLTSQASLSSKTTGSILYALFPTRSYLPNLKCLHISSSQIMRASILLALPNLKRLVLGKICNVDGHEIFPAYFANLWTIRQLTRNRSPGLLDLKSLDAIGIPKSNMKRIIELNLPLEHLALSLSGHVRIADVANLIDHYAETLISLKLLRCKTRSCPTFWQLPLKTSMANLNELELWGNMVKNLNFLRSLPSLVKLKVEYCCFECPYSSGLHDTMEDEPDIFQGDMVANTPVSLDLKNFKLVKLQEFVTDCKMSEWSWERLTKWMPNLRVLEAPMRNNKSLLVVCDRLEKLEKLRVRFGSDIDDDGILSDPVIDEDCNTTFCRGITKLTHLRAFEMEVECGQARLTDISADLGFLNLNHLGYLKLGFTGNLITEEVETRLRDSIGHFEMYRTCSKVRRGETAQKCCEWADFKRKWRLA